MVRSASRREWRGVPEDPDLHRDLDYRLVDLDVIDIDADERVMVLPQEEDMLREDAFIVATTADVWDVAEWA